MAWLFILCRYQESSSGSIDFIESKSVAICTEHFKFKIQKSHLSSGFVVYMVPAPRVEFRTYWFIESKSVAPNTSNFRYKKATHWVASLFIWCRHQESNSGPTDYKSVALPTELCRLNSGARTRNRTRDTRIFNPLLYRLSYSGN